MCNLTVLKQVIQSCITLFRRARTGFLKLEDVHKARDDEYQPPSVLRNSVALCTIFIAAPHVLYDAHCLEPYTILSLYCISDTLDLRPFCSLPLASKFFFYLDGLRSRACPHSELIMKLQSYR
jgi:hypothetical protein